MECNEKLQTCLDHTEEHRAQLRKVQLEQYQCTTKYVNCTTVQRLHKLRKLTEQVVQKILSVFYCNLLMHLRNLDHSLIFINASIYPIFLLGRTRYINFFSSRVYQFTRLLKNVSKFFTYLLTRDQVLVFQFYSSKSSRIPI